MSPGDRQGGVSMASSCPSGSVSPTWTYSGVIGVMKHNWSAAMDGYKLFRKDRQGRRGGGVALYVRECFDCLELNDGDNRVECLWVRIRGKANKADIMVRVL